ncbi:PREDICTED: uncharacterized protein LOC104598786 [Nelumbo nucifera]|uniref:Uncharacterized protein LOC104598786 n=1 Tax=Nelumbo nucifera TaxID=4432 RepID=A0A1U8AC66_NELNU|nr:PREDICTED: uncharacterized protein LOC104598786 [Nelumbo nucifera]
MKLLVNKLLGRMKGKKKQAVKRPRVESPQAVVPEPKQPSIAQPPVIDLVEEELGRVSSPHATEEATSSEPAPVAVTSSGSEGVVQSILTPKYSLLKSKSAVYAEEVANWAELSVAQLGARAATHCMVVNSVVHALTYQSELHLKQAIAAESSSHEAHSELNMARNEINQLKNDARDQKELTSLLMSEKKELAREKAALKREVENLEAHVKECTKILLQAVEEAKAKAVEEYKTSEEFHGELIEVGTEGYRKGFKLTSWLTRCEFSQLDLSAITTSRVIGEMVVEAAEDPDSEAERDSELLIDIEETDANERVNLPAEASGKGEERPDE